MSLLPFPVRRGDTSHNTPVARGREPAGCACIDAPNAPRNTSLGRRETHKQNCRLDCYSVQRRHGGRCDRGGSYCAGYLGLPCRAQKCIKGGQYCHLGGPDRSCAVTRWPVSAHALQCQACLCRDARPLGPEEAEPVISALPGCRCRRPPCEVRLSGWQVSSPACDARLAGPVIARPSAQRWWTAMWAAPAVTARLRWCRRSPGLRPRGVMDRCIARPGSPVSTSDLRCPAPRVAGVVACLAMRPRRVGDRPAWGPEESRSPPCQVRIAVVVARHAMPGQRVSVRARP